MEPYVLSDEEQEEVDLGVAAQSLLDSEPFQIVMKKLLSDSVQAILSSEAGQTEARERAYLFCKAVEQVESELGGLATRADQIVLEAMQQTESVSQEESPDPLDGF